MKFKTSYTIYYIDFAYLFYELVFHFWTLNDIFDCEDCDVTVQ